jgi:hypothetical protein
MANKKKSNGSSTRKLTGAQIIFIIISVIIILTMVSTLFMK